MGASLLKKLAIGTVCLGAFQGLAGCDKPPAAETKGGSRPDAAAQGVLACFPPSVRPWIPLAAAADDAPAAVGGTVVYLDRSASMQGYLRAGGARESFIPDLLKYPPWGADQAGYKLFGEGETTTDVPAADLARLARADAYNARASHIDAALEGMADDPPNQMSVLISDLWMDNRQKAVSDAAALGEPLRRIMVSGRSVAVYGFNLPYQGRILDTLPSGRRNVEARRRPLYLVAAGPSDRLAALDRELRSANYLKAAFSEGRVRRTLFSLDPKQAAAPQPANLEGPLFRVGMEEAAILPRADVGPISQYTLKRDGGSGASPSALRLVWRERDRDVEVSRPLDVRAATVTVWAKTGGRACAPGDWRPYSRLNGEWSEDEAGGIAFRFDPRAESRGLPGETLLIVGEVPLAPGRGAGSAAAWMRSADWAFDWSTESERAALNRDDGLAPTLGLARFADALESAHARALTARDGPKAGAGFAFIVRTQG
jgi:hypothetical protein